MEEGWQIALAGEGSRGLPFALLSQRRNPLQLIFENVNFR